jgi:AbrB family looped-hinge helix DNA binding protein
MRIKDIWGEPKFFGSATVGPRGQMVIPVNARKELGIDTGTTLLLFTGPESRMLVLLPADIMEHMLGRLGERLAQFEELVRDYRSKAAAKEKGD